MSRRRSADKREVLPDAKFGDIVLTKFMNKVMLQGKKGIAEQIVYGALTQIEQKTKKNPLETFHQALNNVRPEVEVRSRRVGGATYQVPMEVSTDRRTTLAIRWILSAARERAGKSFSDKLASELIDAFNETGSAIRKRDETHKMADANKAFAHYRW